MDAENEIERQNWHPNVVRMRMIGYSDANLEAMTRNDHARQVERDVAAAILADRKAHHAQLAEDEGRQLAADRAAKNADKAEKAAKLAALEQQEAAERDAYRKNLEAFKGNAIVDRSPGEALEAPKTENELAARMFADALKEGLDVRPDLVHVMKTEAISGNRVRDGWTVNYHDGEAEVGLVAVWWGRGHFKAYIEIVGHIGRTAEAAALLGKVFTR